MSSLRKKHLKERAVNKRKMCLNRWPIKTEIKVQKHYVHLVGNQNKKIIQDLKINKSRKSRKNLRRYWKSRKAEIIIV